MGFSTILWVSVALWALNGWFQGFGAPSGAVALTAWFSNRERGRFYGVWSTAHSMGEGLTYYFVALFVTWLGWRAGFWVPGLICILSGIAHLRADAGPAGDARVAEGRGLEERPPRPARATGDPGPDAAVLDPAHPLHLGARGLERDRLHHALRDRELGHPVLAGRPRLRARRREPIHGDRHAGRHRRLPALRLCLRQVLRRAPSAGKPDFRDRRACRAVPDLLRAAGQWSR